MITIAEIKTKTAPILKRHKVEFAGVFGSVARGEARNDSDVDILAKFAKPTGLYALIGLEQELAAALHRKVDLATEGSLHRLIKNQVLSELKVIYGRRQPV